MNDVQLRLWHGRNTPNEDLNDWGFDGPTLNDVESFESSYNATNTIRFLTPEAFACAKAITGWPTSGDLTLEISGTTDLIETREPARDRISAYYGKWFLSDSSMISSRLADDMRLALKLLQRLESPSNASR